MLADHGRTTPNPLLNETPLPLVSFTGGDISRPVIALSPLTQQGRVRAANGAMQLFDPGAPANGAFAWRMGDALPAIYLLDSSQPGVRWLPERDLLASDRFSRAFVVEVEVDSQARLRFGDGVFGARPDNLSALSAVYRVGSGLSGNVGPETITALLTTLPGILSLRNPLPASGGAEPETIQQAQLYAPQAFRAQERAVTPEDYADFAGRHPQVQRAQASLRWTGSWHTVFVTIDRKGGLAVDEDFRRQMLAYLEPYRIAGYDLEVSGPTYVPLDLSLAVCVAPGYFKADVQEALLRRLGSRDLTGGARGFFHPDNFTFGQPVFLSQVFAAALKMDGVESLEALRFQRWGKTPNQELENGVLETGMLEVARLDNDPNFPENGRLELILLGGL
jgi:predicted phage baseplate assembly protein